MSSQENIEIIKDIYEAFARGDADTIMARVASEVDWATDAASDGAPWFGRRTNRDAVAGFFGEIASSIEVLEFVPESIAANEDEVHTLVRYHARATRSGQELNMNLHHVFRLRDGQIVFFRGSEDTEQTVAALAGERVGV
jgi:uncharacterized protein